MTDLTILLLRIAVIAVFWVLRLRYRHHAKDWWRRNRPLHDQKTTFADKVFLAVSALGNRIEDAILRIASSFKAIFALYVTSILLGASFFSYFEHETLWNGIWWSEVSALTIGYGDLYPKTVAGRAVAMIFQHFWIFGIAPMVVARFITWILPDPNVYHDSEQRWTFKMLALIVRLQLWQAEATRQIARQLDVELAEAPSMDNLDISGPPKEQIEA